MSLPADRLPAPVQDEIALARTLHAALQTDAPHPLDWAAVGARATPWIDAVRERPAPFWAMESLLREYPISSQEGLALMRLAEALLRVPDQDTAIALTADQLGRGHFNEHDGSALFGRLGAQLIELSRHLLPHDDGHAPTLLQRLGARTVVGAAVRAVQLLGQQFVHGEHIETALHNADAERRAQPTQALCWSYDMLGEGARTAQDASHYLAAYQQALRALAARGRLARPQDGDGLSIKLSALEPRYEATRHAQVLAALVPQVLTLVDAAAAANLNLTIDAEESERLELSLLVLEALMKHVAARWPDWAGLGLAVQAYQLRAPATIEAVAALAQRHGLRLMVRLVKGAYWDAEIKRAQELGLAGYPVWTRKEHTDLAYLACAQALLRHQEHIYPQFATHNAATIAAVLTLVEAETRRSGRRPDFELQRLHGMGQGIYRELMSSPEAPRLRIYAPVGRQRDLLAYLVRRLLENGANSSFVHQLADESVPAAALLASPLQPATSAGLELPPQLYGAGRRNAAGRDLLHQRERAPVEAAIAALRLQPEAPPAEADPAQIDTVMRQLAAAQPGWNATPLAERCAVLLRAAEMLEQRLDEFCARL
ncbi:MAG: hypothetical protein RJA44_2072, partial [Pseudomonadota bacterium]